MNVYIDHNYSLPLELEDIDHIENLHENGTPLTECTDTNYCLSTKKLPKSLLPLDAMKHITDFQHLRDSLKEGCKKCSKKLDLTQALGVLPMGLGGYLYIRCESCHDICKVKLSKTHKPQSTKAKHHDGIFDVNTKAASGMIRAGLGERSMNNFLSVLNLNTISTRALKQRENEVGEKLEIFAAKSQKKWSHEELKRTIEKTPVKRKMSNISEFRRFRSADRSPKEEKRVHKRPRSMSPNYKTFGMHGSIDTMWQRRAKAMNSMSGVSTCHGRYTGKVIRSAIRCKRCRKCFRASRNPLNKEPPPHRCKQNWDGSSKAMEPDMLCELVQGLKKDGLGLETVSGNVLNTSILPHHTWPMVFQCEVSLCPFL